MRLINNKRKSKYKIKQKRNLSKKQKRNIMSAGDGPVKTLKKILKHVSKTLKYPFKKQVRVHIDDIADITDRANIDNTANRNECSICLDNLDNTKPISILICTHKFHTQCIDEWRSNHNNCPLCNAKIEVISEEQVEPPQQPPPIDIESLERSAEISQQTGAINILLEKFHKTINNNETQLRKVKKRLEDALSKTNNQESKIILSERIKQLESNIQKQISFSSIYPTHITTIQHL
jgi:hypothetical protein